MRDFTVKCALARCNGSQYSVSSLAHFQLLTRAIQCAIAHETNSLAIYKVLLYCKVDGALRSAR